MEGQMHCVQSHQKKKQIQIKQNQILLLSEARKQKLEYKVPICWLWASAHSNKQHFILSQWEKMPRGSSVPPPSEKENIVV